MWCKSPLLRVTLAVVGLGLAAGYAIVARERGWGWPVDFLAPAGPGGIELVAVFPAAAEPGLEPLAVFGTSADQAALLVEFTRPGFGRLSYATAAGPVLRGREFALQAGRARWIKLQAPVLWPAAEDIWYEGQPAGSAGMRDRLRVRLDGQVLLDRDVGLVPAGGVRAAAWGRRAGFPLGRSAFGGVVRPVGAIPADADWLAERARAGGILFLGVAVDNLPVGVPAPLVSTKAAGQPGVAVTVTRMSAERLRFAVWREGEVNALAEAEDAWDGRLLSLQITLASLPWPAEAASPRPEVAQVALEGRTVLSVPLAAPPVSAEGVRIGAVAWPLAGAATWLAGEITAATWGEDLGVARDSLLAGRAVDLDFELPASPGGAQPLLCLGFTGRADSVFADFSQPGQVRFGLDHWGSQPIVSAPVALRPGGRHRVRIALGVRLAGDAEVDGRLRLWLDGEPVLDRPVRLFSCPPEQVYFGANPVGMSTSAPVFAGRILRVGAAPAAAP